MISAKLIKDLEQKGFKLDLPGFNSREDEIIEILSARNDRLNLAIPLLLEEGFDYGKIKNKLGSSSNLIHIFNKIIIIANNIFKSEKLDYSHLEKIIKENKIISKITDEELSDYHEAFRDSLKERANTEDINLKDQIQTRSAININKALSILYSPGKIKIMNKIFSHEPLTNTELKYYYRSIRPIILSVLNEGLQKYVRIIESMKKYRG